MYEIENTTFGAIPIDGIFRYNCSNWIKLDENWGRNPARAARCVFSRDEFVQVLKKEEK